MEEKNIDLDALSPMMRHYLQTKEEVKGSILFYRLGDFYEMFFEDARLVSEELDLTLTGKACGLEERAPMCGVPFHSADNYINRLIEKGYKVAICEQVEDPKTAKGIVKREITRVITPGTNTDTESLDEGKNNYIMSIMYMGDKFGVAFSDFSTGEFFVTELDKQYLLVDEINKLIPSEIIANEYFFMSGIDISELTKRLNIAVSMLPNTEFDVNDTLNEIINNGKNDVASGDDVNNYPNGLQAAGALISYMKEMQKSELSHIISVKPYVPGSFLIIDSSSLRNLEVLETSRDKLKKGSLLGVLDKTRTAMGKRLLNRMLRQPLADSKKINERLDAVEAFVQNPITREEIREYLEPVHDMERLLTKISLKTATPRDLVSFKYSLETIPAIKQTLKEADCELVRTCTENMDNLDDLYQLIDTAIVDEPPVSIKDGMIIKDGYLEEIDNYRKAKMQGKEWLAQIEEKEKEKTGIRNLKIRYNKVFGYYLEVTNSFKDKVPDEWIRKQTLTNAERYITPELKKIEDAILGANEKLNALEYEIFSDIRDEIAKHALRIQNTAYSIAMVDVICNFAKMAERNKYVRPKINNSGKIIIKNGRHPVVEMMMGSDSFVANDTQLDLKDEQIGLITGPNMAGKSTYMRQVAIITLMAHAGSFVPASFADVAVTDRIFTRVGASDDLASGQSTFMVEMNEVSNILKNATKKSLLILDEIGRGTGTLDGLSIARAVVEFISKKVGAKTLFATHYHELTSLEGEVDGVLNYSIAVKENGEDIVFLRKIVRGGTDKSYGIHVAKLAGVPDSVISRAKEILKILSDERIEEEKINVNSSVRQMTMFENPGFADSREEDISLSDKIRKEIEDLDINNMTPMDALKVLYKLKDELREE